jgi:hypothetical protein
MATCNYCNSTILFGGKTDGQLRFCNDKCYQSAVLVRMVPFAELGGNAPTSYALEHVGAPYFVRLLVEKVRELVGTVIPPCESPRHDETLAGARAALADDAFAAAWQQGTLAPVEDLEAELPAGSAAPAPGPVDSASRVPASTAPPPAPEAPGATRPGPATAGVLRIRALGEATVSRGDVPVTAMAVSGATPISMVCPAPCRPHQPPVPVRVSTIRVAATGTKRNGPSARNIPVTSTITSTGELVYTHSVPSTPTGTNTAPAMVSPACQFTLDTSGRAAEHGYADRNPAVAPPVTVTVAATAPAPPGAGTGIVAARPVTGIEHTGRGDGLSGHRNNGTPWRSTMTSLAALVNTQTVLQIELADGLRSAGRPTEVDLTSKDGPPRPQIQIASGRGGGGDVGTTAPASSRQTGATAESTVAHRRTSVGRSYGVDQPGREHRQYSYDGPRFAADMFGYALQASVVGDHDAAREIGRRSGRCVVSEHESRRRSAAGSRSEFGRSAATICNAGSVAARPDVPWSAAPTTCGSVRRHPRKRMWRRHGQLPRTRLVRYDPTTLGSKPAAS